jgi:hypothetical protein
MAYVVSRPGGSWEIRESRSTPAGPRSRTLASFRTLTPEVLSRAAARSAGSLDTEQLRHAARRAGAAVAAMPSDVAAAELIRQLDAGNRPRPALERLLLESLQGSEPDDRASDNARAAAAWVGVSGHRRGQALRELLRLADQIPRRRRPERPSFPRIQSRSA